MINIDIERVVNLYNEGFSMTRIAEMFNVDHSVIKHRLLSRGIALRSISESTRLAFKVDPSLGNKISESRRKYQIDENFFDELTEASAYIIGFIQADGHLRLGDGRLTITLKPSDANFLKDIARQMGANRPLTEAKSPFGNGVCFTLYSKKIVLSLHKWGLRSPKKHTSTHPDLLSNRDYWRGMIDGDGTLHITPDGRRILALVGVKKLCKEFLSFCQGNNCGQRVHVCSHKSIFNVRLSGGEARTMAEILYKGAKLYLPRKMNIFRKF